MDQYCIKEPFLNGREPAVSEQWIALSIKGTSSIRQNKTLNDQTPLIHNKSKATSHTAHNVHKQSHLIKSNGLSGFVAVPIAWLKIS